MEKIRFALIGGGWRAEFYARIARQLPDYFEITGAFLRDREKAEIFSKRFGISTTSDIEELLSRKYDFVVLSLKKGNAGPFLKMLFERRIPILCETPPSTKLAEMLELWEAYEKYHGIVQVAEQYQFQPLFASWLAAIKEGMIGEPENISLSFVHGYHATSLIRMMLGIDFENVSISGKRYAFSAVETFSRSGMHFDGLVKQNNRDQLTFEFENGKVGFFDFSNVQYHSFIRSNRINVQGPRGEINDLTIRYLNRETVPVALDIKRVDLGVYHNEDWAHHGMMLGDRYIYINPFYGARLNDDELAIAICLKKMKEYVDGVDGFYGFDQALQDAYLSALMAEALKEPGKPSVSQTQPWAK